MMPALRTRSLVIPGARSATRDPSVPNDGLCFMGPGSRTPQARLRASATRYGVLAPDDSRENSLRSRPGMTRGLA
jgi:hypothetical protein